MPYPSRAVAPRFQPFFVAAVILTLTTGLFLVVSRPASGKITIATLPVGAAVLLEGHYCPAAPCDFELAPGEYHVEASLENYHHAEATVDVTAHGAAYKTLHLLPMVPTPEEAKRMGLIKKPEPGEPVDMSKR